MHERLQASAFGHVLDMIMLLARNRAQAQMREPRVIMVAGVVQANVSRRRHWLATARGWHAGGKLHRPGGATMYTRTIWPAAPAVARWR